MKPSLIFCPAGSSIIDENHWRWFDRHTHRLYQVELVNYKSNEYEPTIFEFDTKYSDVGQKWELFHNYLKTNIDSLMEEFEYIGVFDDDVIMSTDDINHGLIIAHNAGSKLWQLSVSRDSDEQFDCLKNIDGIFYTVTDFNEIMCGFYHTSLLPKMLEFFNLYNPKSGWGFDKVACDIFNTNAMVIHSRQMKHPHKEKSSYDKSAAFEEMRVCIEEAYPVFMKKHYHTDHPYEDSQKVILEVDKLS